MVEGPDALDADFRYGRHGSPTHESPAKASCRDTDAFADVAAGNENRDSMGETSTKEAG